MERIKIGEPMQWNKVTISTTIYAQDLISAMLYDMDIYGVEVVNNIPLTEEEKEAMFIDILPELDESDTSAKVIFYLENDQDIVKTIKEVQLGLINLRESGIDIGSGKIILDITKDEDWANNWKKYFKAFRVADDIVIKPTWLDTIEGVDVKPSDIVIEIDPDMAFGTGSHETTRLAISGIRKYLTKGQSVLDLGSGSGILAIISKKLGASKITATDIDGNAVLTARENASVNGIKEDDINFIHGDVLNKEECKELDQLIGLESYDIVVANILTEVIINLSDIVGKYLKDKGYFISTGILQSKADRVKKALESNNFDIVEMETMGDWVSFVARKNN